MAASKHRRGELAPSERGRRLGRAAPFDGHAEGFAFEFEGPRIRIALGVMLDAIRRRGEHLGGAFTIKQFDAWEGRPCSADCICARFGSWRRALQAAGIEGAKGFNFTPEELIENLEAAWRSLGRRPGQKTLVEHGTIGVYPYTRGWGSVERACRMFAEYKRGKITRRALLRPRASTSRKPLAKGLRWRVLERDGHRCAGCGRGSAEVKLEVDHIVPVAKGGGDEEGNLRVLCLACNRGKGGMRARNEGRPRGGWTPRASSNPGCGSRRVQGRLCISQITTTQTRNAASTAAKA